MKFIYIYMKIHCRFKARKLFSFVCERGTVCACVCVCICVYSFSLRFAEIASFWISVLDFVWWIPNFMKEEKKKNLFLFSFHWKYNRQVTLSTERILSCVWLSGGCVYIYMQNSAFLEIIEEAKNCCLDYIYIYIFCVLNSQRSVVVVCRHQFWLYVVDVCCFQNIIQKRSLFALVLLHFLFFYQWQIAIWLKEEKIQTFASCLR